MQKSPDLWIETYGIHYVSDVLYGASFMGYQCLQQRQEYSANSLHVFAGIDISETFFNVGASEDFSKTHSKYSESIALTFDMGVRGGPPLNGTYATPIEMGTAFTNWK